MTAAVATIAVRPAKIGGDEAVRRSRHESQNPRHGHTMTEGQSRMLEMRSERLENRSRLMREFMQDIGGPVRSGENRARWVERVAFAAGLSYRRAKSVWYREPVRIDRDELDRAEAAAHHAKQAEIAELRARLDKLEKDIAETDALASGITPASSPLAHGQS